LRFTKPPFVLIIFKRILYEAEDIRHYSCRKLDNIRKNDSRLFLLIHHNCPFLARILFILKLDGFVKSQKSAFLKPSNFILKKLKQGVYLYPVMRSREDPDSLLTPINGIRSRNEITGI